MYLMKNPTGIIVDKVFVVLDFVKQMMNKQNWNIFLISPNIFKTFLLFPISCIAGEATLDIAIRYFFLIASFFYPKSRKKY